jgi:toxin HigB-1
LKALQEKIWGIAFRIALRYSARVIREFRHKGLKRFFETGSKAGIQPKHANRLRVQLGLLDVAAKPADMDVPGWELHGLKWDLAGQWSVWVNGNWRLTFSFEGEDAVLVDYQDTTEKE